MPATRAEPLQSSLWGAGPVVPGQTSDIRVLPLDDDSFLLHAAGWLGGADAAFAALEADVPWKAHQRPMYDRIVDVPRLTAAVDPASVRESRSGEYELTAVEAIIDGVRRELGACLEHIGLNLYRDGADSVAWHRDRIGDRRDWSVVALVSLGGPRVFQARPFRHSDRPVSVSSSSTRSLTLHSGDLLVMGGAFQRDWEHRVPKSRRAAPRISIACRTRQFPQGPLFQHAGVTPWCVRHKLE